MRILFLTQYFPPEMGAPQARLSEMALGLKARGHEVSVLTAIPNYPGGKVFDGYKGHRCLTENYNGLSVMRTWISASNSIDVIPRLLSYLSFVVSAMYYGSGLGRQDVIIVESPPLFLGIVGIYLARRLGAKMVFNVSDLWPDSAVELGVVRNPLLIGLARRLERKCYQQAALITGQSPTIVNTICSRALGKPVELITNGVDPEVFSPRLRSEELRKKFGVERKFALVYAGLFGVAQGLGQILDAARKLEKYEDVSFLLWGDGAEKNSLVTRIREEGIRNVRILPPVPKSEVPPLLASMDAAVVPLKTFIRGALPSKIFESMASGLPLVFIGGGDGATIISKAEAGLVVQPGDRQGLVEAVTKLYSDPELRRKMSANGVATVLRCFSRDRITQHFDTLLHEIGA